EQNALAGRDSELGQARGVWRIGPHPLGDPASQDGVLGRILAKTNAAFMRHLARRLLQDQTGFGIERRNPPALRVARQAVQVEGGVLTAQRQTETVFAVEIAVAGAGVAAALAEDRHDVVDEADRAGLVRKRLSGL